MDTIAKNITFDVTKTPIFDIIYTQIKKNITNKTIDAGEIILLGTLAMQLVDKYQDLTGPEKKLIVIEIVKKIIRDQVTDLNTEQILILVVDTVLPTVIDKIVDASRGKLDLNKIDFSKCKLFACCK